MSEKEDFESSPPPTNESDSNDLLNKHDDEFSSPKSSKDENSPPPTEFKSLARPRVIILALVFAGAQLIQELAAEALFTRNETSRSMAETAMLYSGFQQLGTVLVALLKLASNKVARGDHAAPAETAPPWTIMAVLAVLVFATTALPNWAVQFVYFPAKVVAKSTKLVPTMFVAVLMGNSKKFSKVDYVSAALLVAGSGGFALNSGIVDVNEEGLETVRSSWWIGLVLLGIASLADALVPNLQQSVMRAGASAEQVALRVNVIGASWILIVLAATGSVTLGLAVLAFTLLIQEAGSVVAVAVATARKVLTLTLSYIVFPGGGKTFGASHLISALAVAIGMGLGPALEQYEVWRVARRGRNDVASKDVAYGRV